MPTTQQSQATSTPGAEKPTLSFWCEATQTWLYRDDSRPAFKNRPLDEQPPPPEYLQRTWSGAWQTRSDGLWEIRPFVATAEDGFRAGLDLSWQGGDGGVRLAEEAQATLDLAKAAAARLASAWHDENAAPEETHPDRPRPGN